ncbi:twin-arginine translocase subunit TatC [uncultured Selenomonas sp.]|uniref:twin-arginine translocase subunit TatC n=1 Tax=uncultured Selenomonas sp. TaxID=159275 RepID=UPI0025E20E3D|nr:twin-arginine translocase subunit TatC [uncultured Selenomonas sp.]
MTEGSKPENERPSYDAPFVEPAANPPDAPPAQDVAETSTEAVASSQESETAPVASSSDGAAPPADTDTPEETTDDGSMSLIAHLTELRSRLIKCVIAITLGSGVGYYFLDDIMHYLTAPAGKLYYMQPSEAFFTYLKVSIAAGFLIALPVIFYQVWMFFLPALTRRERIVLGLIVPASVLLFFGGLAFSFFLVFPAAVQFFLGFGNMELEALFSVDKYFDFVIWFVLPFGFVFELPLVMIILAKIGIVNSKFLGKYQRVVFFLAFVIAAMITPTPDVFTQTMIAVPMFLLYEVGYLIVRYIMRK